MAERRRRFSGTGPVIAADISIKARLRGIFNDQRGASSGVGALTAVIKSATEANAVDDSDDGAEGAVRGRGPGPANRFSRASMMEINLSSKRRVHHRTALNFTELMNNDIFCFACQSDVRVVGCDIFELGARRRSVTSARSRAVKYINRV